MDNKLELAATMVALGATYQSASRMLGVGEDEIRSYVASIRQTTQSVGALEHETEQTAIDGVNLALQRLVESAREFYEKAVSGSFVVRDITYAIRALSKIQRLPNTVGYNEKQQAASDIMQALNIILSEHSDKVPINTLADIAAVLHKFTPTVIVDTSKPIEPIRIAFRRTPNRPDPVLNERGERLLNLWRQAMQHQ